MLDEFVEIGKRAKEKSKAVEEPTCLPDLKKQVIDNKISMANIPTRYRRGLEEYNLPFKITMFAGKSDGLFLCGKTGTQKSSIAGAVTIEAIKRGKVGCAVWVSIPSIVQEIKSSSKPAAKKTPFDIISNLRKENSILILDDLGTERENEWDEEIINNILWQSYDWTQKLIITSNFKPEDIYTNPAVIRRLKMLQVEEIK